MFDEINGMPLHPLIIHAPVIGIPLALAAGRAVRVPADPGLGPLAAAG